MPEKATVAFDVRDDAPGAPTREVERPIELPFAWAEDEAWQLVEERFVVPREHEVESLFALGNGYVGTRASLAEGSPLSRPATYVAGVYHRPHASAPPELLPLPDWAAVSGTIDGAALRLERGEILTHRRVLDLRHGAFVREWRHRDPEGRITLVRGIRFASQADRHLLVQLVTLTPESYDGTVLVRSTLAETQVLEASQGARVALAWGSVLETPSQHTLVQSSNGTPITTLPLSVERGRTYRLDRVVAVHDSRDDPTPEVSAKAHLEQALRTRGVDALVADHRAAWEALWDEVDVVVEGDPYTQRALRFAIYHLCSAVHPDDEAVSIGARGLTGPGYKGHVFWDTELYMLPFFTLTRPGAARSLLMYRHRTLDAARARAREAGYAGALYAWESADTGEDVTPRHVLAPDGEVLDVHAGIQEHHISADIAYAVHGYWRATGDDAFLLAAGAEILVETARFWASRVERGDDGLEHIRRVMGPDEYHPSVDDDVYTNELARWNLETAAEVIEGLASRHRVAVEALAARLALRADELTRFRDIAARIHCGFDPDTGLFEQFRGYFDLETVDLREHASVGAPIEVMLGQARIARSQIVKQPDVLMLFALLEERFPRAVREANFRYYEPRTAHGSSLSPPIHALVAARLGDVELALRYLRQTAEIDLANNMGNAAQGVHMAAQGALWQAVVLGFGGLRLDGHAPRIEPHLPASWQRLGFGVRWRGARHAFVAEGER